jgi:predicted transcriptional regulator
MKIPVEERKKYVISLRKRRYTERQIAKELHMSTRDVTKILKENEGEEKEAREREVIEREEKEKKRLFSSKRSEALKLYKKGTKPLDVAIELDISAEEAKSFYYEYCSLQCPLGLQSIMN